MKPVKNSSIGPMVGQCYSTRKDQSQMTRNSVVQIMDIVNGRITYRYIVRDGLRGRTSGEVFFRSTRDFLKYIELEEIESEILSHDI